MSSSRVAVALLLLVMFHGTDSAGAMIFEAREGAMVFEALVGGGTRAPVGPPPCPSFGDGGLDFFQPSNYAEFVRCHNDRYFADYHRPRPIHVLFEASAKTELGSAFGLMKALAKQPEKYKVTYLSPGGTMVRRGDKTFVLGPDERPDAHDTVLYESAFPSEKNEELRDKNINVVLKSMLSMRGFSAKPECRDERTARVLEQCKFSEMIPEDNMGNNIPSEKMWIQTLALQPQIQQNPVDFVVADCFGQPRSVELLMGRAQVPGAFWCGNLGNFAQILEPLRDHVYQLYKQVSGFERFRGAELTPVFSASFLGWAAEEQQPFGGFLLGDAPVNVNGRAQAQGPTRAFMLGLEQNRNLFRSHGFTGPIFEQEGGFKVPISLVSNLSTATVPISCTSSLTEEQFMAPGRCPRPRDQEGSDVAVPAAVQAIVDKKRELGATRLIYIAFGSQGFTFKKAAYKQIIEEAAAVDNAVVFFVVPPAADWEDSPVYPYQPDFWRTDYYNSATVAGKGLTLPKNVLLSTWAPQKAIFEQFPGPNTVFLTHGGAGSLSEGIVNNIALACFALDSDQPRNCAAASKLGAAVDLRPFSKKMLLEDRTIEGSPVIWKIPSEGPFQGDETPDAGDTIRERIEHIFTAEKAESSRENENKFQKALADLSEDLRTGAYAQDAVVGVFENTMEKQLRLYKEMGLFDWAWGRDRGNVLAEGGPAEDSVSERGLARGEPGELW